MKINGWIRTSLIDFPQHIATVLFTGGCNFRCPMCHNADLVLNPADLPAFAVDEVLTFLAERAGKLTGVVITGGEPTLQPDLLDFVRSIRALDYAVKLDTNGYLPDVLETLLAAEVLDYVAMDLKAPPEKYASLSGLSSPDVARVERSIALLAAGDILHEFRTTVVPDLLTSADIVSLARWLADAVSTEATSPWYLQQFRSMNTLDPALQTVSPYPLDDLGAMAKQARRWFSSVDIR